MYQELKSEMKEIIEIVNHCPEKLQEKCFELLLENCLLAGNKHIPVSPDSPKMPELDVPTTIVESSPSSVGKSSDEEISEKDFHIKTRKFLSGSNITMGMLNSIYYKENGKLMPLYESLKSNKMTGCQNRVTLLSAFENSLSNDGEMTVNGELVRQRCQELKCYDAPHFADTFKRFSTFFDNWGEKYEKNVQYALSSEGKKELAKIITELAEGE